MAGTLGHNNRPQLQDPKGPYRPPAKTDVGSEFNAWTNATISLTVVLILFLLAAPVAVVGMVLAWAVWKTTRPTWLTIAVMSVGCVVAVAIFSPSVIWWWPWGAILPDRLFHLLQPATALPLGDAVRRSLTVQLMLGPPLLLVLEGLLVVRERTLTSGIYRQARAGQERQSTLSNWLHQYASVVAPRPTIQLPDSSHPPGGIRLGADNDNKRRPFDLEVSELRLHSFLPGASGSGKTTTIERIADGAMASGWGLVVIDCKGGGLRHATERLAALHGLPFVLVDPQDSATVGYNPCTGTPSDIANKLIGSFTFGEAGEIYKQIGMAALPVIVRGLVASKTPVTLMSIAAACEQNNLRLLARKVEDAAEGEGASEQAQLLADELSNLIGDSDPTAKSGIGSLRYRLSAIVNGGFQPLLSAPKVLDWDTVLSTPCVTYISLPVTAASEDVELMGRVLLQDIKQACSRRLRLVGAGHPVQPVLVAIDEFAGLKEARQIIDLLLQSRQAEMALLLATQVLPQDPDLHKAVLQAGLLVVHRLEAQDAEELAAQFGTKSAWKVTQQIDWETGTSQKGSVRDVEEYVVHPNLLRRLPVGQAAVRSVTTDRHAIVNIIRTP